MTKEITKAIILQEIQDRFQLRDFADAKFLFDETVVPVYDLAKQMQLWTSREFTRSITSATFFDFFSVPENQRWHVSSYDVIFMTGAFTVAGMYVSRVSKAGVWALPYLDLKAAQNVSYHIELKKLVRLEPLDKLYVNVDGYTSTGNLRIVIDYVVEDIR